MKILVVGALLGAICIFTMGCDDGKNNSVNTPTETEIPHVVELVSTSAPIPTEEPKLKSNESQFVYSMTDDVISIYYCSGDEIIGHEDKVTFESDEDAENVRDKFEFGEGFDRRKIESMNKEGNVLIIKYTSLEYSEYTLSSLKEMYSDLEIK
jgi:hypothetical protein